MAEAIIVALIYITPPTIAAVAALCAARKAHREAETARKLAETIAARLADKK